jgi:hypothetical protein
MKLVQTLLSLLTLPLKILQGVLGRQKQDAYANKPKDGKK